MRFTFLPFFLLLSPVVAQEPPKGEGLGEMGTRSLVRKFQENESWTLRATILVSLGGHWHPSGAEILVEALRHKTRALRAYALETLRRTKPETLPSVATKELMDELIQQQLKIDNNLYRGRVLDVLRRIAPDAANKTPQDWQSWWAKLKDGYVPKPWTDVSRPQQPGAPGVGQTVAEKFIERGIDLNTAGLEVVLCLDTTGSMQPTIDAARDAMTSLMSMLRGIAPKLRVGLIQYKDVEDMKDGAQILVPLTGNVEEVHGRLSKLNAGGGGDEPEKVEKGMEMAVSPRMGWLPSTNKVVVVIGDAPPHPSDVETAKSIAKDAFEKPFGKNPDVATGPGKKKVIFRRFITSTIGVGVQAVAPATDSAFRAIAEAGGGAYATLITTGAGTNPSDKIVEQILTFSFGKEWEEPVAIFVEIYREYKLAGFF